MAGDAEEDRLKARAEARLGAVLRGKWRLDRVLGSGGMASVYAATHRNGSRAAVKVLHPELCRDSEVQRRFLREGYLANSIGHPGAVRVLDDDKTDDGAVYIVMELLDGETLETRRNRLGGRLPPAEAVVAGALLLDVLAAAHDKGVVHRDIKTENVFLTTDGRVMLLDFGIARAREMAQGTGLSMATRTGATLGTPAFMPPEQALGLTDEVDARSDLWAVGATLFTLLAGRLVHEARTLNELLVASASRPARPLATVAPEVPARLAAVVDRALAFDKAARWPDARAMAAALRAAGIEHGLPERQVLAVQATGSARIAPVTLSSTATIQVPTQPPARQRWGAPAAAAFAVVATVGVVALAFELRFRRAAPASVSATSEPLSMGETPKPPPQASPERPAAAASAIATATAAASGSAPAPVVSAAGEAHPPSPPASATVAPAPVRRPDTPRSPPSKPRPPPSDQDLLDRQH